MISTDSPGELMSLIRSRMPSMTTKPILLSTSSAESMIFRRCYGVNSLSIRKSSDDTSQSDGSPAILNMR